MNFQDWQTVVLKEKAPITIKEIKEKPKISNINSGIKISIDESGEEIVKIKMVSKNIANLITQARIAKKLTRKELANLLNMKEDIITNIETCKAIYDGNQIAKIKKTLNIK
jgi:ribosome-binding protein aMBF1 (putative translation factor)